jgi:tetratricopeptide (TPR) repeat protein
MPKRPRTHVTGSKAVRAFINALPDEWVIREPSEDYGIDLEVEVFENGRATGLTFKVQSKGTDAAGSLARKIKRRTINYWRKLDVPVLVVLWDKTLGVPRYRWAHTIGMDRPINPETSTVSVRFEPSAAVDAAFVAGLPAYLERYRSIKRGDIEPPLRVTLTVEDGSNVSEPSLRAELQRLLSETGNPPPFRLSGTSEDSAALRVERNRVVAQAPLGLASASMRIDGTAVRPPNQIAMDLLVLMASAMTPVNPEVASLLAHAGGPFSRVWADAKTADRLAPVLAHPSSSYLLSWVLQLLHDIPDDQNAYETYLLWAQGSLEGMPRRDFQRMTGTKRDQLDAATTAAAELVGDERLAANADLGRRYFNLANIHRRHRDWQDALGCLDIAATLEPRYQHDALYHEFVASCSWYVSDFDRCVGAYERAVALGTDDVDRIASLLPDALFRAGKFRAAYDALATWSPVGAWFDRVPIVDRILLQLILDYLSIEEQSSEPMTEAEWNDLTSNDTRFLTEEEAREALRTHSVFQPGLWTAVAAHRQLSDAFEPLLMAAVLQDTDETLWVAAAVAGIVSGQDSAVIGAVVDAALFATRNRFYDRVRTWLTESDAGEGDQPSRDIPAGAPVLTITPGGIRDVLAALVALAGERMESVPSVGTEHRVRLVNTDDSSQPLVQRSF